MLRYFKPKSASQATGNDHETAAEFTAEETANPAALNYSTTTTKEANMSSQQHKTTVNGNVVRKRDIHQSTLDEDYYKQIVDNRHQEEFQTIQFAGGLIPVGKDTGEVIQYDIRDASRVGMTSANRVFTDEGTSHLLLGEIPAKRQKVKPSTEAKSGITGQELTGM